MGFVRPEFQTLSGAGLELGHRYVTRGVLTRHVPWLVPVNEQISPPLISIEDEMRFVLYRYGRSWGRWALLRAMLSGYVSIRQGWQVWRRVSRTARPLDPAPFIHQVVWPRNRSIGRAEVSVLIPTLDRYSYLRTLLGQFRRQTIQPLEILIVDQTAAERRDTSLAEEFADLPLRIRYLDQPGQCSSRNTGLREARGEYVLFLDDDDEIPPTLIERHLQNLHEFQAQVSAGVADEVGAGPLPEAFTYTRISDVFPTNNTLIHKETLRRSGLFDLAYDHGQRADGDLGMRVYLSGALMVLQPDIPVMHHHAGAGGLRAHKARVITYASSRRYLTHRHLPSVTEIYLAKRYFSARQVREMLWLRVFGTFSIRGSRLRKLLKVVVGLVYLPHTQWQIHQRYKQAVAMMQDFPKITK
jgi:glycosyltransferase involved in cell wall biosynthesis